MPDAATWNQRYQQAAATAPQASQVLQDYQHLLPAQGDALDVACGTGGNALLLAQHGLQTQAWDYAEEALNMLDAEAQTAGITIQTVCRDVVTQPPSANSFDVIVVSHFLDRSLTDALIAALKPLGLLFYQTFSCRCVSDAGPKSPEYRLADNELLHLFCDLQLVAYREEGVLGDTQQGWRDRAMLVAHKPA